MKTIARGLHWIAYRMERRCPTCHLGNGNHIVNAHTAAELKAIEVK